MNMIVSKRIQEIAKKYNVEVVRDVENCENNQAAYCGEEIVLGYFDDENKDNELVAFFHELGHVEAGKRLKRSSYFSKISQESMAWEVGLNIAKEEGYEWNYYSPQMDYARTCLASYLKGAKDELIHSVSKRQNQK